MNYRKIKAKRNRKGETQSQGNSQSGESVFKVRARRNNATAKEELKEIK